MIQTSQAPWKYDPPEFLKNCLSVVGFENRVSGAIFNSMLGVLSGEEWLHEAEDAWERLNNSTRNGNAGGHTGVIYAYSQAQMKLQKCLYALLLKGNFEELRQFYQSRVGDTPVLEELIARAKKFDLDAVVKEQTRISQ